MDKVKMVPINLGRNEAKKLVRHSWKHQRAAVVANGKLHGVKTAKLKSYYDVFGY